MFVDKFVVKCNDLKRLDLEKVFLNKTEAEQYLTEMQNKYPELEWTIDVLLESEGF